MFARPTRSSRASAKQPRVKQPRVKQPRAKQPRAKQPRVKQELVQECGYLNQRLLAEDTAEFDFRPRRAKTTYRVIVLRKLIEEERGQLSIGTDFRYFFYVTNDGSLSQDEVVAEANDRCSQENIIEQLKNGVRASHAPPFLQHFVLIPAQILMKSRSPIIRLLSWRPELPILFRLLDAW